MSETETTASDHDLYARQGIGSQIGFGEHPAVIVVDYQLAFTRGPLAGDYPEAALQATARIASAARALGAPVSYSYCAYEPDLSDAGPFGVKCPGLAACERGSDGCLIDPLVTPADGDLVFEKQQPSAFFGPELTVDRKSPGRSRPGRPRFVDAEGAAGVAGRRRHSA